MPSEEKLDIRCFCPHCGKTVDIKATVEYQVVTSRSPEIQPGDEDSGGLPAVPPGAPATSEAQSRPAPLMFDICETCDERGDEDCLDEPCSKIRYAASEKISRYKYLLDDTRASNDHWLKKFREAVEEGRKLRQLRDALYVEITRRDEQFDAAIKLGENGTKKWQEAEKRAERAEAAHHIRGERVAALEVEFARWKRDYTCVCGHEIGMHNLETGECGLCACKDMRTAPSGEGNGDPHEGYKERPAPAPETPGGLPNCVKFDCNCDDRTPDDKCKCPRRDTPDGCRHYVKAPSGVKPDGNDVGQVGRMPIPPSLLSAGHPARTRPEGAPKEDPIKEIYERFRHLDKLLSDRRWLAPDESSVRGALWDIWQAIRKANGVEQ